MRASDFLCVNDPQAKKGTYMLVLALKLEGIFEICTLESQS